MHQIRLGNFSKKNLKADIDEEKREAIGGTVSLLITQGKKVAVKMIDAWGNERLKKLLGYD